MSTDTFRDFALGQLSALGNPRYKRRFGGRPQFKTNPGTLPDFPAFDAAVFAPSEKQVLTNYREVTAYIPEDNRMLVIWAQKAARS